jgi:hypothetical protein
MHQKQWCGGLLTAPGTPEIKHGQNVIHVHSDDGLN